MPFPLRPTPEDTPPALEQTAEVVGPQNEGERHLQVLILEAFEPGPSISICIDEFADLLRARIQNPR
ncbi:hypothetical protein HFRIS_018501 [Herbaspirillum frisingense GSF30]|uniref:Uncharacterized protein n=1 Tax=Herbaspirillum frisingense GSF30 TaxID=864073 RepID=A0AAI9N2C1_9BURK|nr:hypothetical protein HFRIS_018501 [Herbaspirillum frisingense GSF30]